jgi:plastocyanin
MKKLLVLAALVALSVPAVAGSSTSERASKTVGAYNNYFSPNSVKVSRGSRVTWVVRRGVHNVRGSGMNSANMGKGGKYSKKFKRGGTYKYVCTLHSGMKGKVVVR